VELVIEEMKRVRRYFNWRITWWRNRMSGRDPSNSAANVIAGCSAYAAKQIALLQRMESRFTGLWKLALKESFADTEFQDTIADTIDDLE
jgi:hypothetical protein